MGGVIFARIKAPLLSSTTTTIVLIECSYRVVIKYCDNRFLVKCGHAPSRYGHGLGVCVWPSFHFTDISRLLVAKFGLIWSNVATCRISLLLRALVCKSVTADHLCEEF
jgi:hypothetical protein